MSLWNKEKTDRVCFNGDQISGKLSIVAGTHISTPINLMAYLCANLTIVVGEGARVIFYDTPKTPISGTMQRKILQGTHSHVHYECHIGNFSANDDSECASAKKSDALIEKKDVQIRVVLEGPNAQFDGFVRACCSLLDNFTMKITQEHRAPYTKSLFDVRQVLDSHASVLMTQGLIDINRAADYASAEQRIKNIVLEEQRESEVGMRPDLRVANATAIVKHGCAVGQLDLDQMMYLQARGLSKKQAKKLLLEGFLSSEKIHGRLRW
jgi:Fe-S cluster assembly scaffold protein SufB